MAFVELNSNIKYVIGIDFGHGETSAAIARLEKPYEVKDVDMGGGERSIPSAILIRDYKGIIDTFIGRNAISEFENECDSQTDTFKCSFKDVPSMMDDKGRDVMKTFFKEVYNTILAQRVYTDINDGNHCVVIACPSNTDKWNETELEEYVKIASEAGLPIVKYKSELLPGYIISGIVRESRAAYIKTQTDPDVKADVKANLVHGGALAIDFGSSTVDLTYYNPNYNYIVDYGTTRNLGAQKVELLIYSFLCEKYKLLKDEKKYKLLKEIKRIAKDKDIRNSNYLTYSNAYTSILLSIRKQKEDYYKSGARNGLKINIDLYDATKGLHDEFVNLRISSQDLDEILSEYCDEIRRDFIHFKEDYLNDRDVSILIMTGGASRMGFVRQIADEVFCPSATKFDTDPELTISHGVAVAGQADILVVRMLEDLLAKDEIRNASIWPQVKRKIVESIASDIISDMDYRYSRLKDGQLKTINSVSVEINNYISEIAYARLINAAYSGVLTNYINDKVHQEILTIMSRFFPTAPQDRISKVNANNQFSISISTGNIDTINSAIATSVKQIEEKFVEFFLKTIFNIVVVAGDALVKGIDKAYSIIESGARELWGAMGGEKWDKIWGDYEFGDLTDNVAIDYRDENTELSSSRRLEVYNSFISKKDEYKSNLEQDIRTALGDALESDINNAARKAIKEYILDCVSRVRLLLN